MMKKSLYLLSLLCLIGAPLAHGEIVIFSGITNSDFCKRAEDEAPIDRFAEQAAQFLLAAATSRHIARTVFAVKHK